MTPAEAVTYAPHVASRISPDGRFVAIVVPQSDPEARRRVYGLHLGDLSAIRDGSDVGWMWVGEGREVDLHEPAFSPDSRSFAAIRTPQGEAPHIAVFDLPLRGFSPYLALAESPVDPHVLKWLDAPQRLCCLGVEERRRRVYALSEKGEPEPLTPVEHSVRTYATHRSTLAWIAGGAIYVGAAGEEFSALPVEAAVGGLSFSPDGTTLAFRSSNGPLSADTLWTVSVNGANLRCLSAGLEGRITSYDWSHDGDIVLAIEQGVAGRLLRVDAFGNATPMAASDRYQSGPSCARHRDRMLYLDQDLDTPQRLVCRTDGEDAVITRFNDHLQGRCPGERVSWSHDGLELDGLWVRPDTERPCPVVVWLHGGPAHSANRTYSPYFQVLAAAGYGVFAPNYRGSSGRSNAFLRASVGDLGGGDLDDVRAGVAHLREVDDIGAVGVFGWHYGGTLGLLWAARHPDEVSAVVGGSPFVDWMGAFGAIADPAPLAHYFTAAFHEDRSPFDQASPITWVKTLDAPTLLFQGREDRLVPLSQATLLYRALRARGVPTDLVYYLEEGHVILGPEAVEDLLTRVLSWLDTHC